MYTWYKQQQEFGTIYSCRDSKDRGERSRRRRSRASTRRRTRGWRLDKSLPKKEGLIGRFILESRREYVGKNMLTT